MEKKNAKILLVGCRNVVKSFTNIKRFQCKQECCLSLVEIQTRATTQMHFEMLEMAIIQLDRIYILISLSIHCIKASLKLELYFQYAESGS